MTRRSLLFATLLLFLLALSVCASSTDENGEDLIASHVGSMSVGPPTAVGSLLFFPVYSHARFPEATQIQPVGRALASGTLVIREMPEGMDQGYLMASYEGEGLIFGQYGGTYGGGGQGRGGSGSFFMSSLTTASIPVVCFEEGRMEGRSPYFDPTSYVLAHPALRGLSATGNQDAVWREIQRHWQMLGPVPIPLDLGPAYPVLARTPAVAAARGYLRRMAPDLAVEANGVIVACGDQILGIDYYGDPKLFAECRVDVLDSYAAVNAEVGNNIPCRVTDRAIGRFLWNLAQAPRTARPAVLLGERAGIAFGSHMGEAAALEGHLVYLGAHDTRPPLW